MANYLSLRSSQLNNFSAYNIIDSTITTTNVNYSSLTGSSITTAISATFSSLTYSTLTGASLSANKVTITSSIVSLGQSTNAANFGQTQGSYVPTSWYSTLTATFTPTAVTKVSMAANAQYQLAINGQSTVSSIMLTSNASKTWTSLSAITGLPSATTTNYSSGAICSLGIYSLLAANGGYLYLSNNTAASYLNVNPNTPYAHYKFDGNVTDSQGNLTLTATGSPTYVPGIVGTNSLNISNTAGGTATTYLRSNYSPGSSFTVSLWFNFQTLPTTNDTGAYIICLGNATYNNIFTILYLNLSGYTGFYVQYYTPGGLASLLSAAATTITANRWYNITVIMQPLNGMNYVYLNNQLLNSSVSAGLIQPITGISIGANFVNTANAFNGYIDDLKIYNTAIPFSPMVPANWSNVAISGNAQYMLATAANGGLFMSNNFGSTWSQISAVALQAYWTGLSLSHSGQYMVAAGGSSITPQLTGLGVNTWTVSGVTWTASGSSLLNAGYSYNSPFNNSNTSTSWTSAGNYSNGVYNNTYSTAVLGGIGTLYGEWLQIQSSVPLVMYNYSFTCAVNGHYHNIFYIIGSTDGTNWYPIQRVIYASTPFNNWNQQTSYLLANYTGTQTVTAALSVAATTTSYSTSTNTYTYFRVISTSLFTGGTYSEINQWYINFLGGQSYSTNYGQTWTNTLQQSTFAVPNSTAATTASWTANGVTWTSASSPSPYTSYTMFNNVYSGTWNPLSLTYSQSGNTSGIYTTIQGIGIIQGDWLQLQSSVPLVLTSYQLATGDAGGPHTAKLFYLIGSNDGAIWYPINQSTVAASPNTANFTVIPGVIQVNSTAAQPFGNTTLTNTTYSTTTSAYSYFRLLVFSSYSPSGYVIYSEWLVNFINNGSAGLISSTFSTPSAIAVSGNGQYAVGAFNQTPYIISNYLAGLSTNSYTTPTLTSINANITGAALSYTGQQQVLVTAGTTNNLYYSTNYGSIFTGISLGSSALTSCAMSYDGSYITAATTLLVYTLNSNGTAYTVAVGALAGQQNQGQNSIAIGNNAGQINQTANSIVLNAQSTAISASNAGLFVAPIANAYQSTAPSFNLLGYSSQDNQVVQSGVTFTQQQVSPLSTTTTLSIAGPTTITGPLVSTVDAIGQGLYLTPSAANSATILSYFQKVVSTVNSGTTLPPFWQNQYTFGLGPAHGRGGSAFSGGVLLPNGNVCMVPTNSTFIGIYNPTDNTYTNGANFTLGASAAFHGGILLPTGIIIFASRNSLNIGIYNPLSNGYTDGPAQGQGGSTEFIGGVVLPNGNALLVPHNSAYIGIYNTYAGTFTLGPAHGMGADATAFAGGVLLPNGNVILIPNYSLYVGIYNYLTNTYTNGPAHGQGTNAFSGGVLLPNGNVVLVPYVSANIGIYNPTTNTYTQGPSHGQGSAAFHGGALLPSGIVVFSPHGSVNIGFYNPYTNTYIKGPAHGQTQYSYYGCTVLPNGNVIFIPWDSLTIGILSTSLTSPTDMCMSPYFNKF